MQVTIRHLGDVQFEAEARGHRVLCDQPAENRGSDRGMTPPELFLASLGTCAAYYAAQYLKARSLSTERLEIKVECEKALKPARLAGFRIEVLAPELPAGHEAGLLRAVDACLIRNTLLNTPSVETVVRSCAAVL
jgi:putative redox protein